mmetsp:Transcript_18259/g.44833  ORF Transcript_18259/g.44833 Transcript_18259/m.44833 type:complete len:182 (-) Transcript_18259:1291-1836(-)
MDAYSPFLASNSWCDPSSSTLPPLRTMILSTLTTVLSRCAMMMEDRPLDTSCSACMTFISDVVSSALVASSHSSTFGALSTVRAMATRCFSPPLTLSPLSPTLVCSPFGSIPTRLSSWAIEIAILAFSSEASGSPYFTLYSSDSLKSTVSCGTTPSALRRDSSCTPLMSCPSTVIAPPFTS